MPDYIQLSESAFQFSRPIIKAVGEILHSGSSPHALQDVLSSWELGENLNSIVRSKTGLVSLVNSDDASHLNFHEELIFSAAPGSVWAKIGHIFELYSGKFLLGGDLQAVAFNAKVKAIGNSFVTAHSRSLVNVTDSANVEGFDHSIIRVDGSNLHLGDIVLHDRSNLVDLSLMHWGKLVDGRPLPSREGELAIPTSMPSLPFLNTHLLHFSNSPTALAFNHTVNATFGIERIFAGRPILGGTSFLINDRKLVTAGHLTSGYEGPLRVYSSTGKYATAKLFDVDARNDLAILELDSPLSESVTPLRLATAGAANPGDNLVMVGRPGVQGLATAYPGQFLQYRKLRDVLSPDYLDAARRRNWDLEKLKVVTNTGGGPGTSGGPLCLTRSQTILGITQGGWKTDALPINPYSGEKGKLGFYTPSSDARDLLDRHGR